MNREARQFLLRHAVAKAQGEDWRELVRRQAEYLKSFPPDHFFAVGVVKPISSAEHRLMEKAKQRRPTVKRSLTRTSVAR